MSDEQSLSVSAPPAAGYTTSRTTTSGAATAASLIFNRMFSLPRESRQLGDDPLVTHCSTWAWITVRCTTADEQLDERVGNLSRPRVHQRGYQCQVDRFLMGPRR